MCVLLLLFLDIFLSGSCLRSCSCDGSCRPSFGIPTPSCRTRHEASLYCLVWSYLVLSCLLMTGGCSGAKAIAPTGTWPTTPPSTATSAGADLLRLTLTSTVRARVTSLVRVTPPSTAVGATPAPFTRLVSCLRSRPLMHRSKVPSLNCNKASNPTRVLSARAPGMNVL